VWKQLLQPLKGVHSTKGCAYFWSLLLQLLQLLKCVLYLL